MFTLIRYTDKMKSKMTVALLALSLGGAMTVNAQTEGQRMILAPMDIFVPHWQVGASGGAGYDLGEGDFVDLLSPTFQVTGAYHFNEFLAARLSVSGLLSKNRYENAMQKYQFNYIQPAIEIKADLASLLSWWDADRKFTPFAIAGVGVAYSFNNDDVVAACDDNWLYRVTVFEKMWEDHQWNPVVRAGLGAEYWFTERLAANFEVNANMLPDKYNSKSGHNSNCDWRFNALVGLQYRLGNYRRKTPPVYQTIVTTPVATTEPTNRYITRDQADLSVNIHFDLNSSMIRETENDKLNDLCVFLRDNPTRHVLLTGYADKTTGTPEVNTRLSIERSAVVAQYLREHGIDDARIHTDFKGDRIQPFEFPAANRVCVCVILNPEYL